MLQYIRHSFIDLIATLIVSFDFLYCEYNSTIYRRHNFKIYCPSKILTLMMKNISISILVVKIILLSVFYNSCGIIDILYYMTPIMLVGF